MTPELERAQAKIVAAMKDGMQLAAFDLASRSAQDAPIQDGRLRGSAYPKSPEEAHVEGTRARMTVEVGFTVIYAAAQHEGHFIGHRDGKPYEWRARNWPGGGGPKFLERNVATMGPRYEAMIAAKVAEATRG